MVALCTLLLLTTVLIQGVTKRCRLSWLTNSALVYEAKMRGDGRGVARSQPMSTAAHRSPKINFGDLSPYLTYVLIGLRHGWGEEGGGVES